MQNVSINTKNITPETKKSLLENHQAAIIVLKTLATLVKNPILKLIINSVIELLDFICDKLLASLPTE